jgi:molybdenum-dependent DNA-binding transcriptional regulator ModE
MTVIGMSTRELGRLETVIRVQDGRISIAQAARELGLGRRQVYRLVQRFEAYGPAGLVSRKRGRPSNHSHGRVFRSTVLALVREHYADFGPTLAAEKLAERHGLRVGIETLRQWMIADGVWVRRKDRVRAVHQPRSRRDCLGELVQIDGCEHAWFEDRGPPCTLLVFIDDATGRLMQLRFVPAESAFAYMAATRAYVEAHGKPIAFYSDKHGIFRINRPDAARGDGMTQFGRALHELNIDIICANSPQAKGRVERAHKTLQDRLAKELRLAGIGTIEAANAFLPTFMADYNASFGRAPRNAKDLHRPLAFHDDLDEALSWREERTVTGSLTLHYNKVLFLLEPNELTRGLARKRVTIHEFPDGRLAIRYRGTNLAYRTFDKLRRVDQAAIVENKRLGAVLAVIRDRQAATARRRNHDAPSRSFQPDHMFPE